MKKNVVQAHWLVNSDIYVQHFCSPRVSGLFLCSWAGQSRWITDKDYERIFV